jgi:hypothetical protein
MFLGLARHARSQAVINSSSGYQVHIDITPISLVIHNNPCTYGYFYDVVLNYTITFTGTTPPDHVYTLFGTIGCANNTLFFNPPNGPSSGTITTTSWAWRSVPDCNTATVGSLPCNEVDLWIQGPGIPYQHAGISVSPLPIELVSFEANLDHGTVQLDWATATEKDNAYFTVKRSADAVDFRPLLQQPGAGNSQSLLHYSAIDPGPLPGVSYYRLRQTDIDGGSTLSDVVAVVNSADADQSLVAWPNPANTPEVELPLRVSGQLVEIRAMTGALVRSTRLNGNKLPCDGLAPGTYLLRVAEPAGGTAQCVLVRY